MGLYFDVIELGVQKCSLVIGKREKYGLAIKKRKRCSFAIRFLQQEVL